MVKESRSEKSETTGSDPVVSFVDSTVKTSSYGSSLTESTRESSTRFISQLFDEDRDEKETPTPVVTPDVVPATTTPEPVKTAPQQVPQESRLRSTVTTTSSEEPVDIKPDGKAVKTGEGVVVKPVPSSDSSEKVLPKLTTVNSQPASGQDIESILVNAKAAITGKNNLANLNNGDEIKEIKSTVIEGAPKTPVTRANVLPAEGEGIQKSSTISKNGEPAGSELPTVKGKVNSLPADGIQHTINNIERELPQTKSLPGNYNLPPTIETPPAIVQAFKPTQIDKKLGPINNGVNAEPVFGDRGPTSGAQTKGLSDLPRLPELPAFVKPIKDNAAQPPVNEIKPFTSYNSGLIENPSTSNDRPVLNPGTASGARPINLMGEGKEKPVNMTSGSIEGALGSGIRINDRRESTGLNPVPTFGEGTASSIMKPFKSVDELWSSNQADIWKTSLKPENKQQAINSSLAHGPLVNNRMEGLPPVNKLELGPQLDGSKKLNFATSGEVTTKPTFNTEVRTGGRLSLDAMGEGINSSSLPINSIKTKEFTDTSRGTLKSADFVSVPPNLVGKPDILFPQSMPNRESKFDVGRLTDSTAQQALTGKPFTSVGDIVANGSRVNHQPIENTMGLSAMTTATAIKHLNTVPDYHTDGLKQAFIKEGLTKPTGTDLATGGKINSLLTANAVPFDKQQFDKQQFGTATTKGFGADTQTIKPIQGPMSPGGGLAVSPPRDNIVFPTKRPDANPGFVVPGKENPLVGSTNPADRPIPSNSTGMLPIVRPQPVSAVETSLPSRPSQTQFGSVSTDNGFGSTRVGRTGSESALPGTVAATGDGRTTGSRTGATGPTYGDARTPLPPAITTSTPIVRSDSTGTGTPTAGTEITPRRSTTYSDTASGTAPSDRRPGTTPVTPSERVVRLTDSTGRPVGSRPSHVPAIDPVTAFEQATQRVRQLSEGRSFADNLNNIIRGQTNNPALTGRVNLTQDVRGEAPRVPGARLDFEPTGNETRNPQAKVDSSTRIAGTGRGTTSIDGTPAAKHIADNTVNVREPHIASFEPVGTKGNSPAARIVDHQGRLIEPGKAGDVQIAKGPGQRVPGEIDISTNTGTASTQSIGKIPLAGNVRIGDWQPGLTGIADGARPIGDVGKLPGARGFNLINDGRTFVASEIRAPRGESHRYITGLELALILSIAGIARVRHSRGVRMEGRNWGIDRRAGKPVIFVDGRNNPFQINRSFGKADAAAFKIMVAVGDRSAKLSTRTMRTADVSSLSQQGNASKFDMSLLGRHQAFNYMRGKAMPYYGQFKPATYSGGMGLAFVMAATGGPLGQMDGKNENLGPADRIKMQASQLGSQLGLGRFDMADRANKDNVSSTFDDYQSFLDRLDAYSAKKDDDEQDEVAFDPLVKRWMGVSENYFEEEDEELIETEEENEDSDTTNGVALSQILRRPKWVIEVGQTLDGIAERLFSNADLGWLIADLNQGVIRDTYVDGKRIVELRSRQEIELPVWQDIQKFNQAKKKGQSAENLITIIVERQIDREVVESTLGRVVGQS